MTDPAADKLAAAWAEFLDEITKPIRAALDRLTRERPSPEPPAEVVEAVASVLCGMLPTHLHAIDVLPPGAMVAGLGRPHFADAATLIRAAQPLLIGPKSGNTPAEDVVARACEWCAQLGDAGDELMVFGPRMRDQSNALRAAVAALPGRSTP